MMIIHDEERAPAAMLRLTKMHNDAIGIEQTAKNVAAAAEMAARLRKNDSESLYCFVGNQRDAENRRLVQSTSTELFFSALREAVDDTKIDVLRLVEMRFEARSRELRSQARRLFAAVAAAYGEEKKEAGEEPLAKMEVA